MPPNVRYLLQLEELRVNIPWEASAQMNKQLYNRRKGPSYLGFHASRARDGMAMALIAQRVEVRS